MTEHSLLAGDVSQLKQDMSKVGLLVERLDVTIDELTEVSTSVSHLLAVHETKIQAHDISIKQTADAVERRRNEVQDRFDSMSTQMIDLEKRIEGRINHVETQIIDSLDNLKEDSEKEHTAFNERIGNLEKYVWLAIGASVIIGFLMDHSQIFQVMSQ